MKQRIYIVEDDRTIAQLVAEHLEKWGYDPYIAIQFENIMGEFNQLHPHLVIMDISLPFYNGFHWCAEIRKTSQLPILFLSSTSDNMNQILAMNMGADDFIIKPFDLAVLTAKISALLRRSYTFQNTSEIIEYNNVILDLHEMMILYKDKKTELTKNEFRIMEMLMSTPNTIITREEIMQRLWDGEDFVDDNTLTVNMTRLRKKLEMNGIEDYIQTKKGIGYFIA